MSTVLVIGGTRFFGVDAVRLLRERGHRVVVLSRRTPPPELLPGVEAVAGLRAEPAVLEAAFARGPFDVVLDNIAMTAADVTGALAAGRGRIGHYLLVTTGSVYVEETGRPYCEEDAHLERPDPPGDDLAPRYARGKRQAERALDETPDRVPWTVVRPTMVFGPRDPTNRLTWYLDRVPAGQPVPSSSFTFNPIFSHDLAGLLAGLVDRPVAGGAFNAAGGDVVTVDALCEAMRGLPRRDPTADTSAAPLPATGSHVMAIERARSELAYVPTPLDRWLRITAAARS